MAKVVPLFSGSKGNSYYIGSGSEGILVDAGRSCRQIEQALELNSIDISNIHALFITHEHIVYASKGTMDAMINSRKLESDTKLYIIERESVVGDILVNRINTPHDAAESCCYRVTSPDGKSALIATDMGIMTEPPIWEL